MIFRSEKLKHALLKNVPWDGTFSQFNNLGWILLVIWVNEGILVYVFWVTLNTDYFFSFKINKQWNWTQTKMAIFLIFLASCVDSDQKLPKKYQNNKIHSLTQITNKIHLRLLNWEKVLPWGTFLRRVCFSFSTLKIMIFSSRSESSESTFFFQSPESFGLCNMFIAWWYCSYDIFQCFWW